MEYKTPIKRHSGSLVWISQGFGKNREFYKRFKDSFGNPLNGHNGVDLVLGNDPQDMYGTDLNFIFKGRVVKTIADNPMSSKGNGVYWISDIYTGSDGFQRYHLALLWHMAEVEAKVGQEVKISDKAGDMGNSGIVRPEPTIKKPYNGTHTHLAVYPHILKDGVWQKEFPRNGFGGAVDPMKYIKDLNPVGWEKKDTLENIFDRLWPIRWAIKQVKKLVDFLK